MNRTTLRVMTSTQGIEKATHETPQPFFDWLDGLFHFTLDVAAVKATAKHPRFFSPSDNGLAQSWEGETCWMNPPYGRSIGQWCAKASDEAARHAAVVVGLLPDRRDTAWWRAGVLQRQQEQRTGRFMRAAFSPASGMVWLRFERLVVGIYDHSERLPFDGLEDGAPFPSAVVVWASVTRRPDPNASVPSTLDPDTFPRLTDGWPR